MLSHFVLSYFMTLIQFIIDLNKATLVLFILFQLYISLLYLNPKTNKLSGLKPISTFLFSLHAESPLNAENVLQSIYLTLILDVVFFVLLCTNFSLIVIPTITMNTHVTYWGIPKLFILKYIFNTRLISYILLCIYSYF